MAGIYIHIPYCKQKCNYCNFHFSTQLSNREFLIRAIIKEIDLRKDEIKDPIETLYFGGGTPSLLNKNELQLIFEAVHQNFQTDSIVETTLECNPDDVNLSILKVWSALGINRLSIGIQSFHEADLQFMNRAHNAKQAEDCITLAQDSGFENLSIDLIYGAPTTSDKKWIENLEKTNAFDVPHFSSYALTVEPKTVLAHQIENQKVAPISEEKQLTQFQLLQKFAKEAGFEQYEISNFAKQGKRALHNSNYWQGKPYIGIGPSAHGYDGKKIRYSNIANNAKYISILRENELPQSIEHLSDTELYNEKIMIGLRSIYGISENEIHLFPPEIVENFNKQVATYLAEETIYKKENRYFLHPDFYFQADGIAADLFWIE